MTEEDPFADLGETLDDDDTDGGDAGDEAKAEPDPVTQDVHDPMTTPAFSYDEANQRPFYALEGTIDEFDSWMNYELERELSERGYQDIHVREMTDALLRTVVEEELVEKVVERFEEARE